MRLLRPAFAIACILFARICHADSKLGDNTAVVFATVEEGKRILTTRDEFIQRLSPFDRAARMKVDREISEDEFLNFVGRNVVEWSAKDRTKIEAALEKVQARLKSFPLSFPKTVYFVITTGAEEGRAAYTRGNAVILPVTQLSGKEATIEKLVCHELFHVLSRENPGLKESLYESIGFRKCQELEFPRELQARKITNPDAPKNDHCIQLSVDGTPTWAIPILFSKSEKYDVQRGGEFFNYLQFKFLLVERDKHAATVRPLLDGKELRLLPVQKVTGFFEQVGQNTNYIIHPEEILADNFALLMLEEKNIRSPAILQKMKDVLTERHGEAKAPADTTGSVD